MNMGVVGVAPIGVSEFLEYDFGGVSIDVSFGVKRCKISAVIGCADGLDYSSWLLVLDKVDAVCAERGYVELPWTVSMAEFFRDYESRRLDGVSGMTLTDFRGLMEKVYEKPDGALRHERRVNVPISVDVVTSFLMCGLSSANVVERLEAVERGQSAIVDAVKYSNRVTASVESLLREASS